MRDFSQIALEALRATETTFDREVSRKAIERAMVEFAKQLRPLMEEAQEILRDACHGFSDDNNSLAKDFDRRRFEILDKLDKALHLGELP